MAGDTLRDQRGQVVEAMTAAAAKNAFGALLEKALARGIVAITKRGRVRAVVLSREAYEEITRPTAAPLEALSAEYDTLVTTMRAPRARKAGAALFNATPAALGRAAVKAAKTRA